MESKDLVITVVGIMGSILAAIILNDLTTLNMINFVLAIILLLAIVTFIIAYFLYRRIVESAEIIYNQQIEQKRMGEKLKIHEQLIDIKKDIEILKQGTKK